MSEENFNEPNEDGVEVEVEPEPEPEPLVRSLNLKVEEKAEAEPEAEPEGKAEDKAEKDEEADDIDQYSESVKKRIAALTRKYREAERQRDAAAEYARNVQAERDQYRQRMEALDKGYVGEYENRVKTQIASVQSELRRAMDSHDSQKMVEAQQKLAELTYEQQRIKAARSRQPQPQTQQTQPQQQLPSQQQLPQRPAPDPRAQKWAEKNDWFGKDRVLTQTAMGVHAQLVEEEGFDPESNEYYTELDKRMKKYIQPSATQRERPAQTVAGVSRSTGNTGRKVRLTASQAEMAKKLGVPLEQYAKYIKQ